MGAALPTGDQVLQRVRAEYLEMPGMRLRIDQVQRLCGVDASVCKLVLDSLVAMKFLSVNADGTYVRSSEDSIRVRPPQTPVTRFRNAEHHVG